MMTNTPTPNPRETLEALTSNQRHILGILSSTGHMYTDEVTFESSFEGGTKRADTSKVRRILSQLEAKGLVYSIPGTRAASWGVETRALRIHELCS